MAFALIGGGLLLALFVLWPALFGGTREPWQFSEEDTPLGRLAIRKEVLMGNISDLDFEFAMGKLSENDYRSLRESLKRQTLKIMEQMDVITRSEAAIDTGKVAATAPVSSNCGSCGGNLPARASFCPHCGAPQQSLVSS